MTLQKARALLQRARGACMDEEHVRADSLIEEALREMEAMTTEAKPTMERSGIEEKIEEFRKELIEVDAALKLIGTSHLKERYDALFPPPEPRKLWIVMYEWYDAHRDAWDPSLEYHALKSNMEARRDALIQKADCRNVSRIIEVSE